MKQTKLKTVPKKMTFKEYTEVLGWDQDKRRALNAYADCLPEHVDREGLERNLNYFSVEGMPLAEAKVLMGLAVPHGYNGFEVDPCFARIEEVFGKDATVFIADEVSFEHKLNLFRLWWD